MLRLFTLLLGASLIACGGCASYKLGPTNGLTAGEKALQIHPFSNQTLEPRLGDALTTALRHETQRDATFRLATQGDGDIIVTGTLTAFERHELSFVPKDVLTVSDFRITATAQVTAREIRTGKVILDRTVKGSTLVRVGSDLTSAERQALPLLAEDLAKNVISLLADGSW
jgi:hypothetical protein